MVLLERPGIQFIKSWLKPPEAPGLLAFRHAVEFHSEVFFGDERLKPRSVLYVRTSESHTTGKPHFEAFGAGEPHRAVRWMATRPAGFILHAPPLWLEALEAVVGKVERSTVETWSVASPPAQDSSAMGLVRQVTPDDVGAFNDSAPSWGYRGWRGDFRTLMAHGAAFGVPDRQKAGFLSLAWIFDMAGPYDAIGVATDPKYQRLGLGKAAASALIDHIINIRGKVPLWSTASSNEASIGLASALGLSQVARETLLRWPV
jgi:ribosomal protein S18 acetylase RimI-like enzyme